MFQFCADAIQRSALKPHRKLFGEFTFSVFRNITTLHSEDWNQIQNPDIFLSIPYLRVLEHSSPENQQYRYIIIYKNKIPCGHIYFQRIDFTAQLFGDLLEDQLETIQSKRAKLFGKYLDHHDEKIVMRILTCGNNYVSGEHGFYFSKKINHQLQTQLLEKVIDSICREEKLRGKISAILVKDFYSSKFKKKNCWFRSDQFIEFSVEPNMIIDIPEGVNSIDDYIQCFSKKYRNRAKQIFKSADGITIRDLSESEIAKLEDRIYTLYENVFDKAKFKLVKLNKHCFCEMKSLYKDHFFLHGFFKGDELVAFQTSILMNDDSLEAHYIGIDYTWNKDYELYQNILYQYLRIAIEHKKKKVNLGRTASEIKSTVGAKAHHLVCYIKPQNTVSKIILRPFIQYLQPTEWIPRNPFKEEVL